MAHHAAHAHDSLSRTRAAFPGHGELRPDLDAVTLKALLVHASAWPDSLSLEAALDLGSVDARTRKERLARLFGYGIVDPLRAQGCTDNRATLLGTGEIAPDTGVRYRVPLPPSLSGKREFRRVTITLAWLTPINCKHRKYRRGLVWFAKAVDPLRVSPAGADWQAARRGTVQHEILTGASAASFGKDEFLDIDVSCAVDAGELTEKLPYALCVSVEVAEDSQVPVFAEVATRLGVRAQIRVATG